MQLRNVNDDTPKRKTMPMARKIYNGIYETKAASNKIRAIF